MSTPPRMLEPYKKVDPDDVGFEPCPPLPCPQCDGVLVNEGNNRMNTLSFIACRGKCGFCFVVPYEPSTGGPKAA